MKRINDSLADHTWFKIGGAADIIIPETKQELVQAIRGCNRNDTPYRILGNGSNVLVSDKGLDEKIIKTTDCCNSIEIEGNQVKVGASVMIPQLVNMIVNNGLGGIEYLYSVPGTVGGGIFMNAGRGRSYNKTIADYLLTVEIFDGEEIIHLNKKELDFAYRYSTFQENPDWTILSAEFEFPSQSPEEGKKKIEDRMNHIETRERGKPNAGSIFRQGKVIPTKGLWMGDAKFVSNNRICNMGDASFKDVERLIKLTKIIHLFVPIAEPIDTEVRIWK